MELFWFIPTHGDGRYLGTAIGGRQASWDYFAQVARAADSLGFHGALLPTGRSCEDAWIVASSLISQTKHLKFLVAIRPGLVSPGVGARMAATFDRLSEGRLLVNIVTGGDPDELAGDGVHLSHDDRYRLTDEFLTVWRQLSRGEAVDFNGDHLKIRNGSLLFRSTQSPYPPLYFGGSSPIALDIAARHADVYLTWGEPVEEVAVKLEQVRQRAERGGRTLRFGIRFHVIVRETEDEAWKAAERLIRHVDETTVRKSQDALAKHDSVGQRRMRGLHGGSRESLRIGRNLWAGVGLVRGGAGTALVGDPESLASLMQAYTGAGIETFILSGYPHLEEAYHVAELLMPRLPLRTREEKGPPTSRENVGEIVGNTQFPESRLLVNRS